MNLLNSPGRQSRFVANPSITANSVTQSAKAVHELDVGAVGSIQIFDFGISGTVQRMFSFFLCKIVTANPKSAVYIA
jgi:hypothetical protein